MTGRSTATAFRKSDIRALLVRPEPHIALRGVGSLIAVAMRRAMMSALEVFRDVPDIARNVAGVPQVVTDAEFNWTESIQHDDRRNVTVYKLETASTLGSRTVARFFETNFQQYPLIGPYRIRASG